MTLQAAIATIRQTNASGRVALEFLARSTRCLFVPRVQPGGDIHPQPSVHYRVGGWTQTESVHRWVYATPWVDLAVFQALVRPETMRGVTAFVARARMIEGRLVFEASGDVIERAMTLKAHVSVVRRESFRRASPLEWRCRAPVTAAATIAVSGEDLPPRIVSRSLMGELPADGTE
jgi:hypothetical protein